MLIVDLPEDDPRPLLLIDVDGVLNVLSRHPKPRIYNEHVVTIGTYDFPIRFRKELSDWIFTLVEHYVPVWCTMWDDEANEHLAPLLGLPDFPVIPCNESGTRLALGGPVSPLHHKVPSIEEHVGNRAFAWVDDEIGRHDEAWGARRTVEVAPTYLLRIDQRMGLLEHHVNKLVTWAEELA